MYSRNRPNPFVLQVLREDFDALLAGGELPYLGYDAFEGRGRERNLLNSPALQMKSTDKSKVVT